jgi:hypothetical protein
MWTSKRALRKRIAFQKALLASVQNIATQKIREELVQALNREKAHECGPSLPDGWDDQIGDAIARSIPHGGPARAVYVEVVTALCKLTSQDPTPFLTVPTTDQEPGQ